MKLLNAVINERYGVGSLVAPPEAVLWAAEILAETHGADVARAELSALNRKRDKLAYIPAYPAYGTVLFGTVPLRREAA